MGHGITSACAEQTTLDDTHLGNPEDHLRVCGADLGVSGFQPAVLGSPPRVRSRLVDADGLIASGRITSACAEQTLPPRCIRPGRRDHLRVCGADELGVVRVRSDGGSPPRVRSRLERIGEA